MAAFHNQGSRARALFHDVIRHPNLVALWPLNEQSGNALDRCLRYRLDGTVVGSPTYGVNIFGHFEGVTLPAVHYYTMGDAAALSFERTGSFSIMCLLDPNVSALGEILCKWNGSGAGWALGVNATRTWRLLLQNTVTTNLLEVRSSAALANGTDKMLHVTYDGTSLPGGIVMYEDGAAVAMTTVTSSPLSASIDNGVAAVIGAQSDGGEPLNANTLAFVAVFDAVLTAEVVRRHAFLAGAL